MPQQTTALKKPRTARRKGKGTVEARPFLSFPPSFDCDFKTLSASREAIRCLTVPVELDSINFAQRKLTNTSKDTCD
jgi:hypothetical protein